MAPDNEEVVGMQSQLLETKKRLEQGIAALRSKSPADLGASAPPSEAHAKFPATTAATARTEEVKNFKVGDSIQARYAADRSWYPAQVISIMGSSTAPVYTVRFKGYTDLETVKHNEVRSAYPPSVAGTKRTADAPSTSTAPSATLPDTPFNRPGVISAAPAINTELANAIKKEPEAGADAARPRPSKKARTNKALEKSQASWQNWQNNTTGKAAKAMNKTSIFKTSDAPNARGMYTPMPTFSLRLC